MARPPAARPGPGALALGVLVALGATAAAQRQRELRAQRAGTLGPLGPASATDASLDGVAARVATWVPTRPRTTVGRALSMAWVAPATAVGLGTAWAGGARITWSAERGAWLATGAGGINAVVLRRMGMAANAMGHVVVTLADEPSQRLLDHEFVHVRQAERLGPALLAMYVWFGARHGYRNNPLEVAARRGAARQATLRDPLDPTRLGPD